MKKLTDFEKFEEKYNTILQMQALLADSQFLYVELGRGSGKTTEIFAPRLMRVAYDMPRSTLILGGATYTFILETVIPGLLTYLNKHYKNGIHFVVGVKPPKFFLKPYAEIHKFNHTISFAWGTVIQLVSADRPESMIGKNAAHLFVDELLRIPEVKMAERILPALRGDRQLFGKSPYFAGVSAFSSTPNFDTDYDWWLKYYDKMDKEKIKKIQYVALRLKQAKFISKTTASENRKKYNENFVKRWTEWLAKNRKGEITYIKGSSFSNLLILGTEYIKNQLSGTTDFEKFKLSILGIRPNRVREMFFSNFNDKNIFDDSYKYNNIDLFSISSEYNKTSNDLKYCNSSQPLLAGLDPGHFMSIVFAQTKNDGKELRALKNFYVIHPDQHFEMAKKINDFFIGHKNKTLLLYYDRAGNKKIYKSEKGETDAMLLKAELELLGWSVNLMSIGQRTIFYWEHYMLLNILFSKEKSPVKIMLDQNECEECISSIYMSPLKRTDGEIKLDKSSEVKLKLS